VSTREPTIWMNVTTSANWKRPAVGIVRVEKAICEEVAKLLPDGRLRECRWQEGRFVELTQRCSTVVTESEPKGALLSSAEASASVVDPPSRPNRFARFISLLRNSDEIRNAAEAEVETERAGTVPGRKQTLPTDPFKAGDILISVGLEWDYPYHKDFFRLRKERGIRIITCCYDLIPVLYPQYCVGDVASHFKQYFLDSACGSDAILCISKQSERDLKRVLWEAGAAEPNTYVIALGDNVPSGTGVISEQVSNLTKEPFLLFVSTIERRKNHEVLYRAYHLLCQESKRDSLPKLVFVGMPGWGVTDFLKDLELDPLTKGLIVQLNNANDAELRLLYEAASFCLYPSFYEGWGLPVGEALALGKAVLSSDRGSLPEVGGDLVRYVDPWNPVAWAEAIWGLLSRPDQLDSITNRIRSIYRARRWQETAATVKWVIDDLMLLPRDIDLWPGYTMSSLVGEQSGPLIRSTGVPGYLMFGPYWSFSPGAYRISVWDVARDRTHGLAKFDVVSNQGHVVHWAQKIEVQPREHLDSDEPLLEISVNLHEPAESLQVRCEILSGSLTLSRLKINQMLEGHGRADSGRSNRTHAFAVPKTSA
jgi:glycosyltransferase involved in cell wall biosynthesis